MAGGSQARSLRCSCRGTRQPRAKSRGKKEQQHRTWPPDGRDWTNAAWAAFGLRAISYRWHARRGAKTS